MGKIELGEYISEIQIEFDKWAKKAKMLDIYDNYEFDTSKKLVTKQGTRDLITLVRYKGKDKNIVTPPVDRIDNGAFSENQYLESVKINKSTAGMGTNAFYKCLNLKSVDMEDCKITRIANSAFHTCINLRDVKLPRNLTSLGDGVFMYDGMLKEIELPDTVYSLGDRLFFDTSLIRLTIPKKVEMLGEEFLFGCKRLIQLTYLCNNIDIEEITATINNFTLDYGLESLIIVNIPDNLYEDVIQDLSYENRKKIKRIRVN